MFPFWSKILFACAAIIGLILLIKTVSKLIALYNNPNSVEFSAIQELNTVELKQTGMYELDVKRPYFFGIIPTDISFSLIDVNNSTIIPVTKSMNLLSQRKNMSGERIVPIAEFNIERIGTYKLENLSTAKFKEKDKLLITPKTGAQGFLLIFAVIGSAILFIGGLVFTLLSILKK